MKKLLSFLAVTVLGFVLSGCAGMPVKQDTPMASFNNLIVRPINWSETVTDKISGDEVKAYTDAQPQLTQIFQSEFDKYIVETGYFASVKQSADACADPATLVLEPKIVSLDPGIRWVINGAATYQGVLKKCDGTLVAKYSALRRVGRPVYSTMMGSIETLVKELGEDAASKLPEAAL
jgi:hypothetical protein